jgi:glutaredoxin 3
MTTPILYVKNGCPFCAAACDYLDQHQIVYEQIDVRGDEAGMKKLKEISGQTRTPTLAWNGEVLANFGTDELKTFLAKQAGG